MNNRRRLSETLYIPTYQHYGGGGKPTTRSVCLFIVSDAGGRCLNEIDCESGALLFRFITCLLELSWHVVSGSHFTEHGEKQVWHANSHSAGAYCIVFT
jgi:hypothetical protein